MNQILLDSNIIIYLLNKEKNIVIFLKQFREFTFSMSSITWIEVLAGSHNHHKSIPELAHTLAGFLQIPLHIPVGLMAAGLMQKNILEGRKQRFRDSIIAATAIIHKIPLMTNNPKDFRRCKGLKIIPVR